MCETLGQAEWTDGQQYDVVTCMFAMHYFFDSESALKHFLHNVALNLKPGEVESLLHWTLCSPTNSPTLFYWPAPPCAGGIFMGTIPCGKRVLQILDGKESFSSVMLKLEKRWEVSQTPVNATDSPLFLPFHLAPAGRCSGWLIWQALHLCHH